jgi:hypothetical protein
MLLAHGRFWRASTTKDADAVAIEIVKSALPEELYELRELRIEVPLAKWNLVLKNAHSDRKLLGGLLLDFAKSKGRVSAAVASDRLFGELQRIILDTTVTLVEAGVVVIAEAKTA